MITDENLYKIDDMNELARLTQEAIEKHPERAEAIMKDFSKICKRNNKYTDLDIILNGK